MWGLRFCGTWRQSFILFLTIMVDETEDASNRKQFSLFVCWATNDLLVHEDFLELYSVPSIDAKYSFSDQRLFFL